MSSQHMVTEMTVPWALACFSNILRRGRKHTGAPRAIFERTGYRREALRSVDALLNMFDALQLCWQRDASSQTRFSQLGRCFEPFRKNVLARSSRRWPFVALRVVYVESQQGRISLFRLGEHWLSSY